MDTPSPTPSDGSDWLLWLQRSLQQVRRQAETQWEGGIARWQLQFEPQLQQAREDLLMAIAAVPEADGLQQLDQWAKNALEHAITPHQLTVAIGELPAAGDRALAAAACFAVLGESAPTAQPAAAYGRELARTYAESGFPLILDSTGTSVAIEASTALVAAIVAVAVSQRTAAGLRQFFGPGELGKMLGADGTLRRQALARSRQQLPEDTEWQTARSRLTDDFAAQSDDPFLAATHLGIQGAQVGEFAAKYMRRLLNSNALQLVIPLPLHPAIDAVRLLTSDLVLNVSSVMESSLETASSIRQLELVLEVLPQAQQLPQPSVFQAIRPEVVAGVDRALRPLLAQQLNALANGFDPKLRNNWLNDVGRQLNQWNPIQWTQGWFNQPWVLSWLEATEQLCRVYPDMPVLQNYAAGVRHAVECDRLMEQAEALRDTACQIHSPDPLSE
jgi:hypothetical protein